ncbi:hypothetical protein [Oceanicoccus sp. KOV_DT_Chl]|uniref:hypothetical protein n=1 Tax=Oceanicoccus sp. KOV_DT_Chl TaxID=1904639 RepID=UPI0011AFAD61|nr:hypothetical protein [Oceanicoccus sp. KOV_DT_Chl]
MKYSFFNKLSKRSGHSSGQDEGRTHVFSFACGDKSFTTRPLTFSIALTILGVFSLDAIGVELADGAELAEKPKRVLSAAEKEAQALRPHSNVEGLIKMCHHTLLYSSKEEKEKLVARLDGKTCKEVITTSFSK